MDEQWKELIESVQDEVIEYLLQNRDLHYEDDNPKPKRRRRASSRPNYWDSVWGRMIRHQDITDPNSFVGKKFRRRFRIPYVLFRDVLLPQCRQRNVFSSVNKSQIPLQFKVLISLRMLGRDEVPDTCGELSFVGESTCNVIFKTFLMNYSQLFYDDYVNIPRKVYISKPISEFNVVIGILINGTHSSGVQRQTSQATNKIKQIFI